MSETVEYQTRLSELNVKCQPRFNRGGGSYDGVASQQAFRRKDLKHVGTWGVGDNSNVVQHRGSVDDLTYVRRCGADLSTLRLRVLATPLANLLCLVCKKNLLSLKTSKSSHIAVRYHISFHEIKRDQYGTSTSIAMLHSCKVLSVYANESCISTLSCQ